MESSVAWVRRLAEDHHLATRRRERRPLSCQTPRVRLGFRIDRVGHRVGPSIHRRLLLRVACAVAPGIVLGLLWSLAYPTLAPDSESGAVTGPPPAAYFAAGS